MTSLDVIHRDVPLFSRKSSKSLNRNQRDAQRSTETRNMAATSVTGELGVAGNISGQPDAGNCKLSTEGERESHLRMVVLAPCIFAETDRRKPPSLSSA